MKIIQINRRLHVEKSLSKVIEIFTINFNIIIPSGEDGKVGRSVPFRSNYPLGKYQKTFTEKDYEDFPAEIRAVVFGLRMDQWVKLKVKIQTKI